MRAIKNLILLFLLGFTVSASGQVLRGKVVDSQTKSSLPYVSVKINTRSSGIVSTADGTFSLDISNAATQDTLIISLIGYYEFKAAVNHLDAKNELVVPLYEKSTFLNEVFIKTKSTYRADSLKNRREFASVFNYRKPRLKDIFMSAPASGTNQSSGGNSFNSLAGINLLNLLAVARKNQTVVARLQKSMVVDEEYDYVNRAFSKEKISMITKLKDDSLQSFISMYRPSAVWLRTATEYQIVQYIKSSYVEFLKTYKKEEESNPLMKKPMKTDFK